MIRKPRLLITGASGFIGGFVVRALIQDGRYELTIAGRKRPRSLEEGSYEFFEVGDINGSTDWRHTLTNVDAVVHLAGAAHTKGASETTEDLFQKVNVAGTGSLAQQALDAGVRHFLFVSSIGVNGNSNLQPFSVEDEPSPKEAYAQSKLRAEEMLRSLCDGTSMACTVVRPPLVYGPEAPGNFGLMSSIVSKGMPLPLAGIPNSRSFISVWNLADLLVQSVLHDGAKGETLLVRDGQDVSTSEFLEMIGEASGQKVRLFRVPRSLLKLGASLIGKQGMYDKLFDSLLVDDTHTRKVLDWQPPFTLQESLRKCFQHDPSI